MQKETMVETIPRQCRVSIAPTIFLSGLWIDTEIANHFNGLKTNNNSKNLHVRIVIYCSAKAAGLHVFNRNGFKPIPIDWRMVLALAK